jgi:hypothetical protein
MITVDDVITSSGKYPQRANSDELTDTVRENIVKLTIAVNLVLEKVGMSPRVNSGFRPVAVNNDLKNAGKKSYHCQGLAVDLHDPAGALKFKLIMAPHLLAEYGLWMEHFASTPGWCHLDMGKRPERAVRIFHP